MPPLLILLFNLKQFVILSSFKNIKKNMSEYLFTSESVSEGHPDKVADQISDAVLDAILSQDANARVACETMCSTGLIVLSGEITTHASVDYNVIARETVKKIGYTSSDIGFDSNTCAVLTAFNKQSPDIAQGVNRSKEEEMELVKCETI